jgi:alpha-galactosidase
VTGDNQPISSGVEQDQPAPSAAQPSAAPTPARTADNVVRALTYEAQHLLLTQVVLADGTDRRNELVQERQWLLHPSQRDLALSGNLFVIHDMAGGRGQIFVKQEPLPEARPGAGPEPDMRITPRKPGGFDVHLLTAADGPPHNWAVIDYHGGPAERTLALHRWQAAQRPDTLAHRRPEFLSNTWGDRSRDSRINDDFLRREIEAAARLGVDVLQIDDGWQRGTTSNSAWAQQHGGVWEGFWKADPQFWSPHPQRLPGGLRPIVDLARGKGLRLGLWFAPDSWNDFANWQRDARQILDLHRSLGVRNFKLDGINAPTHAALENLRRFFRMSLRESGGELVFDLDITAGVRPGYFGAVEVGPLFVENRYTDWHNYWPHQTLRNLWMLSRWIDPRRLRMEFLNNTRNAELYQSDALGPAAWRSDALFATVMFSNPLGWFEASNLPADYVNCAAPLVAAWKEQREEMFAGLIMPLGSPPNGFAPTGFISLSPDGRTAWALLFRGLHAPQRFAIDLSATGLSGNGLIGSERGSAESNVGLSVSDIGGGATFETDSRRWETLGGQGAICSHPLRLEADVHQPLGFVFARGEVR